MFRTPDGAAPNIAALAFTLLGYGFGVAALTSPSWVLNAIGFVAVTLELRNNVAHRCTPEPVRGHSAKVA